MIRWFWYLVSLVSAVCYCLWEVLEKDNVPIGQRYLFFKAFHALMTVMVFLYAMEVFS